jgi:hypothetical protein
MCAALPCARFWLYEIQPSLGGRCHLLERICHAIRMKAVRTGARLVGDPAITADHKKPIWPPSVGALRGVVKGVDYRRKFDPQFHDAHLSHLAAFLKILWTRKDHVIVQIVGVLPDVARVRLADIYHVEGGAIFVLLVQTVEGSNLPPEWRSCVASEDEHDGFLPS